jgi:hypothetical protein
MPDEGGVCFYYAKKFLRADVVPAGLAARLSAVDGMCRGEGGGLLSRQVVAMMVDQWIREQPRGVEALGR